MLALLLLFLPTLILTTSTNLTLTFDTLPLPPTSSLLPLPQPYHQHLYFSAAFAVFNPLSPAFKNIITPNDHNCAVSAPNALLGSPTTSSSSSNNSSSLATITIANGTTEKNFTLHGMAVKPMDSPPSEEVGVIVEVKGYKYKRGGGMVEEGRGKEKTPSVQQRFGRKGGEEGETQRVIGGVQEDEEEEEEEEEQETVNWSLNFPYGYHEVFTVRMAEVSNDDWSGLWKVEMSARFGEQGLNWEFCVDDLRVEVFF